MHLGASNTLECTVPNGTTEETTEMLKRIMLRKLKVIAEIGSTVALPSVQTLMDDSGVFAKLIAKKYTYFSTIKRNYNKENHTFE